MSDRKIGNIRKFPLAGLYDGWGAECYINYRPASYRDFKQFKAMQLDEQDEDAALELMINLVKEHSANGNIKVINEDGNLIDSAFQTEDIEDLGPEVIKDLFSAIMGNTDPKVSPEAAAPAPAQPSSDQASVT